MPQQELLREVGGVQFPDELTEVQFSLEGSFLGLEGYSPMLEGCPNGNGREVGVLEVPATIRAVLSDGYQLIAGEHRIVQHGGGVHG